MKRFLFLACILLCASVAHAGCVDEILSEVRYQLKEKKRMQEPLEDFQLNGLLGMAYARDMDPLDAVEKALGKRPENLNLLSKEQGAQVLNYWCKTKS